MVHALPRAPLFCLLAALATCTLQAASLRAQNLPPHAPLRVLIVSDEVNPHGLPPEDLTQPGELGTALLGTPALSIDGVEGVFEVGTDQIEDATQRLERAFGTADAYDVLIYFAHRIPNGADATTRQEDFVAAVDAFLVAGGGVISFHHGIYRTAGKESIQEILGSEATGAVTWDETNGQNLIAVAPGHFITTYGLDFDGSTLYQDPDLGIPEATYPSFRNIPDERYPNFTLLPGAGDVEPLFAGDHGGESHLLGYLHRRPAWQGLVAVYQPGEHEPLALAGVNFQVLLNTILFVSGRDGGWLFGDGFEGGDTGAWSILVP